MSAPKPTPPSILNNPVTAAQQFDPMAFTALQDVVDDLTDRIGSMQTAWSAAFAQSGKELVARVAKLEHELAVLKASSSEKDIKDTISGLIFNFLKDHKGVKFNSGSLASNVEGLTSNAASTLIRLVMNKYPDNIKHEKRDKLSAMYWYEDTDVNAGGLEGEW